MNSEEKRSDMQIHSIESSSNLDITHIKRSKSGWRPFFLIPICWASFHLSILRSDSLTKTHTQGTIVWASCGDNTECERLEVPLDYFNESASKIPLALARYPATNKTGRLGKLLTNPGDPGGSGVSFIYGAGGGISDVLDGRYDLVSWDPRGVNGTTHRVKCFAFQTEQDMYFANTHQEALPDTRNLSDPIDRAAFAASLRIADTRNAALARLCHERSGDSLKHVGTASVVRDLVRLYAELEGKDAPINYWGFSYGIVIGSYLVNMFPDKVGKVVIDTVVNPELWSRIPKYKWSRSWILIETEKVLQDFYATCTEAGPDRCALASHGSTAKDLSNVIDIFLEKLYERPMPVWNATRPGPLTSSMVTTMIFSYLYRQRDWPDLASKLLAALQGNGVPAVEFSLPKVELDTSIQAPTSSVGDAVGCIDTPAFSSESYPAPTLEDMIDEIDMVQSTRSRHFGALFWDVYRHWQARETERFTGSFNHTLAHEMLVIGNTADPVTSIVNARAVNQLMPHSTRLGIQDGSGHGPSAMTSLCTTKTLRAYFFDDKLPENGFICPTDEVLFPPRDMNVNIDPRDLWIRKNENVSKYSDEDLRLMERARNMGREIEKFVGSFMRP